jgi:hypothetical protein
MGTNTPVSLKPSPRAPADLTTNPYWRLDRERERVLTSRFLAW